MNIETIAKCPLGQLCEEVKDGKIHRCMWLIETQDADTNGRPIPQTEGKTCAVPLLSIHLSQLKTRTLGVQHAVESARNENVKRQDVLLKVISEENASLPRQ